jgi:MFS family permease
VPRESSENGLIEDLQAAVATSLNLSEAIRTGAFWILAFGHILWTFGSMSLIAHVPAFLTDQGFAGPTAANALGMAIGISVLGRISFGVLADRRAKKLILSAALVLQALSVVCLLVVHVFGALPAFLVLFGMGLGGGAVLIPLLVGECFGLVAFGKILGLITIPATLGAAAGPVVTGRIFDVTGSYQIAFFLHIASLLAGALLVCFLRQPRTGGT